MPERIQMSRQRPWRAEHPDAVIVDRTTKYGNPFTIKRERCEEGPSFWCWVVRREPRQRTVQHFDTEDEAREYAVHLFREVLIAGELPFTIADLQRDVRGRDVACWCRADQKCHGDPILELANGDTAVHWVGDAPTSLHGNGGSSFLRRTRDRSEVTCTLCRTLLAREDHLCPECAQGKTGNCIGWTLDTDDNEVACATAQSSGSEQ